MTSLGSVPSHGPGVTPEVTEAPAFDAAGVAPGYVAPASDPLGAVNGSLPVYLPHVSPALRSNVVVLSNQTSKLLTSQHGSEYVFPSSATQLASVKAGDILASPFINPFLIGVTSISSGSGSYVVYGNNTSLSSAFVPGNYTLVNIDPLNQVSLSNDWWSGSVQIAVSGSVSISSSVGVSASFCWWYVSPGVCFSFSNSFSLSTTLSITVTGATAFQAKATLAEIPLGCIDVVIGCIIPTLEVDVGVQIQAQNQYTASVTFSTSEGSTVSSSSCFLCLPSWHQSSSYAQSSLSFSQPNLQRSVSIEAFADVPNLGFFFDYIAGPYVEVQPGLQFTTTFSSSITWTLALTLVLNVGVETASWLGGTSLSVSLGPYSWTLASGTLASYQVQFSESGLPSGVAWGVTIDGSQTFTTTGTSETFAVPAGTNTYTVSGYSIVYPYAIYVYYPSPASGTLSGSVSISVTYTLHVTPICQGVRANCII